MDNRLSISQEQYFAIQDTFAAMQRGMNELRELVEKTYYPAVIREFKTHPPKSEASLRAEVTE